jgi:hypothetical protein
MTQQIVTFRNFANAPKMVVPSVASSDFHGNTELPFGMHAVYFKRLNQHTFEGTFIK